MEFYDANMDDNFICLDRSIDSKTNTILVNIKGQYYFFSCDTDDHEVIMQYIMSKINPGILEHLSVNEIINICSFLSEKEREYYRLLYL